MVSGSFNSMKTGGTEPPINNNQWGWGSGATHGLWLHSMYGGVDAVCAFIQHLPQKCDQKGYVTFEWSHDCSKRRVDAYGGGAAFITAKEIKSRNTAAWLNEQIA